MEMNMSFADVFMEGIGRWVSRIHRELGKA